MLGNLELIQVSGGESNGDTHLRGETNSIPIKGRESKVDSCEGL